MQNLYSNISDNMTTWQKELCDMMVSYKINFSDARKYGLVFLDKTILITGDIFENLKEYYRDDTNRTTSIIIYGILIAVVNLYLIYNSLWLLHNTNKTNKVSIYLDKISNECDKDKDNSSAKDVRNVENVKYLRLKVLFLKNKLSEITDVIDNTEHRACKKLAMIKSEILKRFSVKKTLEIKDKDN